MAGSRVEDHPSYQKLLEIMGTLEDLGGALALLNWDQSVNMPQAAAAERARQRATLARFIHEMATSDQVLGLLQELASQVDLDSLEDAPSMIRVALRDVEKRRKLPAEFVARKAEAVGIAQTHWEQAKQAKDFSLFRDDLKRIVELAIEEAELLGYEEDPYDALLDNYEPETRTADVERVFRELRDELVPMIRAIGERPQVDDSFLYLAYDRKKQWDFGIEMLKAIGFDLERGRQDYSAHPFTIGISGSDVRITTFAADDLKPALFATLHEGGHGIHDQGTPARYRRTVLGGPPGLGICESQSRLFENVIGRSKLFWSHHYPRLQEYFPEQLGGVDLDRFYKAINKVEPSLIRVEADELTYHLHIIIRFELERALIHGKLRVDQLPEAWDAKMEEYLGIRPPDPSQGVLQDTHWAIGAIGYFPTYSLGSLLASHWYQLAVTERPEVEEELVQGRCDALRAWLEERVYSYGRKLSPPKLVEAVTGGPITPRPFLEYARAKFGEIYGF